LRFRDSNDEVCSTTGGRSVHDGHDLFHPLQVLGRSDENAVLREEVFDGTGHLQTSGVEDDQMVGDALELRDDVR
jgi:hypothetical protein